MKDEIHILLAKANWCGHCKKFEPIYENATKNFKNNAFLKKYNIEFEIFDLANDDVKNKFMLNHFKAMDKIKGYPTVIVNIRNSNDKKNEYRVISHTERDQEKESEEEKIISGSDKFLNNIENLLKSLESDSKVEYVQAGGGVGGGGVGGGRVGGGVAVNSNLSHSTLQDELYRKKYLKYKSKYMELKNN